MNKFYLYKSNKPNKKYLVQFENPKTNRINTIHFGAIKPDGEPYQAFIDHKDEERKQRYLKRHKGMGENWNNPYSGAGFWARWILWNKPTLSASIKDTNERFDIKIINKTKSKTGSGSPLKEKHSAYRSMKLAKLGLTKPTTKANKGALLDWSKEKWLNLTALLTDNKKLPCGTKGKQQIEKDLPSVCRPSVKVNSKTPKLASNFTDKQIKKAIKQKQKGERILWDYL
jgi:hypothetical protein